MAVMSKDDLTQHIKDTTIPLIKELLGAQLAELIQTQVEASIRAARANASPSIVQRLFAGGEEPAKQALPIGTAFARCLRATAAAKMQGYGVEKAIEILHGWGDHELADKWVEARTKALGSGDPTAGGFLVPPSFSSDIIELLRPAAVVRSLNPLVIPMPNGTLSVPKITTGATATYIGENANVGKTEEKFGQLKLTWKKLAALVPISNDLIRYSSPNADAVVRDDVVRAMAQREDQAFIRDTGVGATPKGLKYWINAVNQLHATGGAVTLANVTIDLGRMLQALMDANIPIVMTQNLPGQTSAVTAESRCGWIMSPRTWRYLTTVQNTQGVFVFRDEMLRGTLWGFPYRVTSQVLSTYDDGGVEGAGTASELYFGAFAHAVIGEALGLQVDASQEAAYHDGSSVVAAFSQDQMVIRVIAEHDFALRHDKAFTMLDRVRWGV